MSSTSSSSLAVPEARARCRRGSSLSISSASIANRSSRSFSVLGPGLACRLASHLPSLSTTPSMSAASSVSRFAEPLPSSFARCCPVSLLTAASSVSYFCE